MSTRRPKLFVAKCHCGCNRWAAFETHRLTRDYRGRYREQGIYADSWAEALRNAIRWTTRSDDPYANRVAVNDGIEYIPLIAMLEHESENRDNPADARLLLATAANALRSLVGVAS